ncbi:MAG: hypothetical protein KDA44_22300 [Planctomycetales bacterium]|nr:hypothetical protein [Planctomycetales bacterium]
MIDVTIRTADESPRSERRVVRSCRRSSAQRSVAFAAAVMLMLPAATRAAAQPVAVTKTNPTKVYMHYMPWFETPATLGGSNWGLHWQMATQNPNIVDGQGRRQIASHFYPQIGPYASSDPDVIEYHLLLMKLAGIDGVLIDWYGVQGTNGDIGSLLANSNALVDRVDDFGLNFGVVLEDRFAANVSQASANVAYLRDNYFNQSSYIRSGAGDDPLLLTFGPITFQQESQWTQILSQAGEDVDLLTLWYESGDAGANADGEYAWAYQDSLSYDQHIANFYKYRAPGQDTAGGIAFPGFDDFYQEGGWGSGIPFEIPHDVGQTLATTLDLATQYASQIDFLQLATWNDFGEGTMFEPTVETGFDYLLQLQQFTGVEYGEAELQLVYDLYRARKKYLGNAAVQAQLDEASDDLAALDLGGAKAILETLSLPGDFNGDDAANGADFLAWQRQWGDVGYYPLNMLAADGNADGVVDAADFAMLQSNFGRTIQAGAQNSVPEPSGRVIAATLAVISLALAGVSGRPHSAFSP